MKIIVAILMLSFIWTSCTKNIDCEKLRDLDGVYVNKKGKPFTGTCTECNTEGQVTLQMELKEGLRHGEFLRFFADGKPGLISEFSEGKQTGPYSVFYSNGRIKEQKLGKDSLYIVANWLEDGNLSSISEEKGDTTIHGRLANYINKKAQSVFTYSNGQKNGNFIIWQENGKINYCGKYKNNKPDGLWIQFFESGKLKGFETYAEGVRVGTWKYFHESGPIYSRIIFADNRISKKTEWDEKGNRTDEFTRE